MISPTVVELAGAAVLLFGSVCIGTVVHELTHAAVLRALGIPYRIEWTPSQSCDQFGAGVYAAWATVVPATGHPNSSAWGVRVASLAPLSMAAPFLTIPLGIVPEAAVTSNVLWLAVAIAWLGCSLPSPQDFSLFWYPERLTDAT